MGRDRAAYMREYRKRQKGSMTAQEALDDIYRTGDLGHERIAELEAEVARLKRELAARPKLGKVNPLAGVGVDPAFVPEFNSRPFTPVPKKGK